MLPEGPTDPPFEPGAPVTLEGVRIGKYLVGAPLGSGGMGQVFHAVDTTLGRPVALKLVHQAGSESLMRLMLEAQALARLEHPHICRIHEVGQEGDRPFIAMQFVDGETLQQASHRLTLREKVMLIRTVAEAIHSAHRLGLVHRDLKPANIMVTRDSEGTLQPVVLDFGLVRDLAAPGLTLTGMPMGTPSFMSPEQAEGESARVDRRSDVFSLGATLYAILLGHPPFEGQGPMETLRNLADAEPSAPRSLDPKFPLDLDTILLTCLAKDPARRYDTARALAEDLGRFLDGDPIAARRPSRLAALVRSVRKNPWMSASVAISLLSVLVLAGLLLRHRVNLEQTSKVAAHMGAIARDVETRMRLTYLLPPHALAEDKAQVRARMEEVRSLMRQLPTSSTGPAHHALGRGHMALGEWGLARTELERAWSLGTRSPEAALSLGLAQAELYQRKRRVVSQLKDPGEKEAELRRLDADLRDPALQHLQLGKSAGASQALVEAILRSLKGDTASALIQAELALRETPAAYEANLLAGALHQQTYLDHVAAQDWGAADADEVRIRSAFERAAAVGRSDPRALEGLACMLIFSHNDRGVYRDQDADHLLEEVDAITRRLLAIDPENARGHCCRAYVLWRRSTTPEANRQAIEEARLATRYDPEDDYGWVLLAATLSRAVDYQWRAGQDPEAALQESTAASETLLRLVPRLSHHGLIALEKLTMAKLRRYQYQVEKGRLSPGVESQARAAIDAALQADPHYQYFEQIAGWFHLHAAWKAITDGQDPNPEFEAILALSKRADPHGVFLGKRLDLRMWALLSRADWRLRTAQDAKEDLASLAKTLEAGKKVWIPAKYEVLSTKVALLQAQGALAQKMNPAPFIRRAQECQLRLMRFGAERGARNWVAQAPALAVEVKLGQWACGLSRSADALPLGSAPAKAGEAHASSVPDLDFERPGSHALLEVALDLRRLGHHPSNERMEAIRHRQESLIQRDGLLASRW